ncbi:IPT/TIG domain-containing protein [Mariniflexile sp. HNIBRBA6329]|uniref:IPT/TIG domain-containing protein n=1 Tax=Mariniflexile sp. HNIBRBA6329 TaxID=3373088 RepID=UPI003745ED09
MPRIFIYTSMFLLVFSCQKDDPTPTPEAINLTLSVSVPQNGGVNLKATYTGLDLNNISESGFLLSNQPVPTLNNSIIIQSKITGNQLENTINTDLVYNGEYFVRAYIKVADTEIYYSDEQSFVSLGSTTPIIKEVPQQAHILDTISISGNYFSTKTNYIKVSLGGESSRIIYSNDSIIKCIVPVTLKSFNPTIEVKIYEKKVTFNGFSLFKPEISSISSLSGTFRDELIINGDHFDFEKSRNKVYFGNVEATITYADRNTLKVLVPDDLESSSEQIKVSAQLQENSFSDNFKLIAPKINFVEKNVFANQSVVIQGANFHPLKDKNFIYFEEAKANISFGDTQNLNTKVPFGAFPRRKAIVKIQLLDLIVEYEVELNIQDKWIMVSNNLPFRFYRGINNAVVTNNTAYVIAPSKDLFDDNYYLWKFNPNNFGWEKSTIPFSIKWSGVAEANMDKLFVYTADSNNSFWEYNPLTQQWKQLPNYPGARRDYATHFSINKEIYMGMGADFEPYTRITYGDFYKYSPDTNTWTQIVDFTYQNYFLRTETSTFTINNIAYVGNGATNTGMVDYWSYHPNTNEWIRIANFKDSRRYTASFELNGFGYVTGGNPTGGSNTKDCWKYNPLSNIWTKIDDIGHIERGGHFSFSLNGKAYVGGGGIYDSGGSNGYDFYEYIP